MIYESPTDLAWYAALAANDAFDRLKEVESRLEAVRMMGDLGLDGVVINEDVIPNLESQRSAALGKFVAFSTMAAPQMLAEASPFAAAPRPSRTDSLPTGETQAEQWFPPQRIVLSGLGVETMSKEGYEALGDSLTERGIVIARLGTVGTAEVSKIFNFGAVARTRNEMQAFAAWRGYGKGVTGQAFNLAAREARAVSVPTLADYEATVTAEIPDGLIAVSIGYADDKVALDIRTLYQAVVYWLENGTKDIRNFGEGTLSFLADYLNHALPSIEPLPVSVPPERRKKRPS